MLGSRFAVLMLFTRVFKQWVLGVIGGSSSPPTPHPRFHIITIILLSEMLREAFKCPCLLLSGVHWLGATFWMVSQQTDIIRSTTRWRIFNLVLGAIHIFFFLNVKYGQSRCRMAGFYLVCASVLGQLITPNVVHILGQKPQKYTSLST